MNTNYCLKKKLPRTSLSSAQTSRVSFLYWFITQWYTKLNACVQFCLSACVSQCFLDAARSHFSLEVGHDDTMTMLLMDSAQ